MPLSYDQRRFFTYSNANELLVELGKIIEHVATISIRRHHAFNLGVSGGSMPKGLATILPNIKTDFKKWKIYFCDERVVPFDDDDSTFGAYLKAFKDVVPISKEQFVFVDTNLPADDAAKSYAQKLKKLGRHIPKFDLLLLGLGPDGHTCSLFPDHPLLDEGSVTVAPITDSPKPPPVRVTLTFPVLNHNTNVFVVTGSEKADAVKRILEDKEALPAGRVLPIPPHKAIWLLDNDAASLLENKEADANVSVIEVLPTEAEITEILVESIEIEKTHVQVTGDDRNHAEILNVETIETTVVETVEKKNSTTVESRATSN